MTTELSEDMVLITTPHLVTADGGGAGVGSTPQRGPFSGSVELGRRLLLAARYGHTAQVLDLMAKGAPFTTDWLGTSPLHVAAYGAHTETCAVLLRAGVSRDSRTKVERTPLHLAAHAGHAGVAALLLERGALVDCSDMLRMTPLHWASERGHAAVVSVLLRYGADPRAVSKFHKTPVDLAAAKGHHAILKLLEDAMKEREAADSVVALKQADADVHMTEIPAAEQQQALHSIERLQDSVKPINKTQPTRTAQIKIELPEVSEVTQSAIESGEVEPGGGAAALLREHGITLLPHDSSTTVLNALQSGRTVVLSDAGKLMLKESSTPAPVPVSAPAPVVSKGVILTAAPVKTPPRAGVKIFTLNNRIRATDKLPIKKIVNPQDMQIKLVTLPESKLSPRKLPGVSLKAKPRRLAVAGARPPVKIIMQKDNFQKMIGKATLENGVEVSGSVQITSSTDLGKVLQVSNATVAPTATIIGSTGVIGSTGNVFTNAGCVIGSTAGITNNTATVIGNSPVTTPVVSNTTVSGSGFMCVPAEFLSSNSPAYLRSQLLSAHKTIHELNQQVAALKEQLAAYENI